MFSAYYRNSLFRRRKVQAYVVSSLATNTGEGDTRPVYPRQHSRRLAYLRRPLRRPIGSEWRLSSRTLCAASCKITSSQKVAPAVIQLSLPAMERMTAGRERYPSMTAVRAWSCYTDTSAFKSHRGILLKRTPPDDTVR